MQKPACDYRGSAVSGSTPIALAAFESALACLQSWRGNPETHLDCALAAAPRFVMAHVLRGYLALCSRDASAPRRIARILAQVSELPANEREQLHLSVLSAAVDDDFDRARLTIGTVLASDPRDAIALHVAQALDYLTGDCAGMLERTTNVLPAWDRRMPGYAAILTMHAFALEETGAFEHAEAVASSALERDPLNVRTHHALAHVHEMTGRARAGLEWMHAHRRIWTAHGMAQTHCWWHTALLHLQQGELSAAIDVYDAHVRPLACASVANLIDASALLWRLDLLGVDAGERWRELALGWAPRIADGYCTFNDLHAMMAFVGAQDWHHADSMLQELTRRHTLPTRHGETTRHVGLAACYAFAAFGQGDYTAAIAQLAQLPAAAHRIGGSHAQRDIVHLTLLAAVERTRREPWRWSARARHAGSRRSPTATVSVPPC